MPSTVGPCSLLGFSEATMIQIIMVTTGLLTWAPSQRGTPAQQCGTLSRQTDHTPFRERPLWNWSGKVTSWKQRQRHSSGKTWGWKWRKPSISGVWNTFTGTWRHSRHAYAGVAIKWLFDNATPANQWKRLYAFQTGACPHADNKLVFRRVETCSVKKRGEKKHSFSCQLWGDRCSFMR